MVKLAVYYSELNYEKIQEQAVYTVSVTGIDSYLMKHRCEYWYVVNYSEKKFLLPQVFILLGIKHLSLIFK